MQPFIDPDEISGLLVRSLPTPEKVMKSFRNPCPKTA